MAKDSENDKSVNRPHKAKVDLECPPPSSGEVIEPRAEPDTDQPPSSGQVTQVEQERSSAQLEAASQITANAYIISASKTKHGPRAGGKSKYAQLAILELYGRPMDYINNTIVKKINDHLENHRDPNCRAAFPISRKTAERAGRKLLQVNREC